MMEELAEGGDSLPQMTVLGLMSGTSADGVDGVIAQLRLEDGHLEWNVLARRSAPYSTELRRRLLLASKPETSDVVLLTQLHAEVGYAYADLTADLIAEVADRQDAREANPVDLVAISGQTVYHIPRLDAERGWRVPSTLQLGEGALVAERCGLPVMCDFRQGDMAAGGQGAPMVSFGDLFLYGRPGVSRAVHNLGGISNLTYLGSSGSGSDVFAFDTGPANCLMDDAAERFFGMRMDEGGELAAKGRVDSALLERWLQHPYLQLTPPKTTGREIFELDAFLPMIEGAVEPVDLMATLCAFSAESIAAAYRTWVLPRGLEEVLAAGGGAHNPTLIGMLRKALPVPIRTFEDLGYEARDREALAFAVMAYFGYHRRPNILPGATGARRPVVVGKLIAH